MSVSTIKIETDLITLMKVLDKTGNPTVATQLLDGTYREPEVCMKDRASSPSKNNGTREQYIFESYDIWADEVRYKTVGSWSREMSRKHWESLELWQDVIGEQIHEMDDVVDTEQGF